MVIVTSIFFLDATALIWCVGQTAHILHTQAKPTPSYDYTHTHTQTQRAYTGKKKTAQEIPTRPKSTAAVTLERYCRCSGISNLDPDEALFLGKCSKKQVKVISVSFRCDRVIRALQQAERAASIGELIRPDLKALLHGR